MKNSWVTTVLGRPEVYRHPSYKYPKKNKRQVGVALKISAGLFILTSTALTAIQVHNKPIYGSQDTSGLSSTGAGSQLTDELESLKSPDITPVKTFSITDLELQSILEAWVKKHPSQKWSVVVYGLKGDVRSAGVNQDQTYPTASVYKLLLTYPLFQQETLESLKSKQITAGGKSVSLDYCVREMIHSSSNPCGHAVAKYIGWEKADQFLREAGYANTDLKNETPTTTAADVAAYLKDLYNGVILEENNRQFVINLLSKQIWRDAIPRGCKACSMVADKVGYMPSVFHDAGIIEHASGAYVLSVFTSEAKPRQISELTRQVQAYMSANPGL